MTTYTYSGYRIASNGLGATTAVNNSSFNYTTTDTFFMRYSLVSPPATGYSAIAMNPSIGTEFRAVVNGTRVVMDDTAHVAEYTWTDGKKSQVLMFTVPGETNVMHIFQLSGAPIPALTSVADFDAFKAAITLIDPTFAGTLGPNHSFSPASILSHTATSQNDILVGNPAFDDWVGHTIKTGAGNDQIHGLGTADRFDLGDGNDYAHGWNGNDSVVGGNGTDTIGGDLGNDTIYGGASADLLYGGSDNDKMSGGTNFDTVFGGDGNDLIYGDYGNDSLYGGDDLDTIIGGAGNDSVDGGADIDRITGGDGADTLYGNSGNDVIFGGAGIDHMNGGTGNDRMTGDVGTDAFYFQEHGDADVIADFRAIEDDLVLNNNLGVNTAAQALSHATQVGANVVFDFGDGDTLTLTSVLKSSLHADNFLFN